jgi:hypothetical protein
MISCLECVAHPSLTPCFFVNFKCKGERLQSVEILRIRDIVKQAKHRGIQVGPTLVRWDATTWTRQVLDLAEPRDKPLCLSVIDLLVVIVFC